MGHGFKSFGTGRAGHLGGQPLQDPWIGVVVQKKHGVPLPEEGGCRLGRHKQQLSTKLVSVVMPCHLKRGEEVLRAAIATQH